MNRTLVEAVYADLSPKAAAIVSTGKRHAPMLMLFMPLTGDTVGTSGPCILEPGIDRLALMLASVRSMGHPDAFAVYIDEAWTKTYSSGDVGVVPPKGTLEDAHDDPERMECILFSFVGKDWQALARCMIRRPENIMEPGELIFIDGKSLAYGAMIRDDLSPSNASH